MNHAYSTAWHPLSDPQGENKVVNQVPWAWRMWKFCLRPASRDLVDTWLEEVTWDRHALAGSTGRIWGKDRCRHHAGDSRRSYTGVLFDNLHPQWMRSVGEDLSMEGMISKGVFEIQQCKSTVEVEGKWHITIEQNLGAGLVTRLLEVTHNGQWLYRNVHVHDIITGDIASRQKEDISGENWKINKWSWAG